MKVVPAHISILLIAAMAWCGCDLVPSSTRSTSPSTTPNADTDETALCAETIARFTHLKDNALSAFDAGKHIETRKLISRGLHLTKEAGRDYELYHAEFLLLQARYYLASNQINECRRFLADAKAIFRIHQHSVGTFDVHLVLSQMEEQTGDFPAALRELEEAENLLPKILDTKRESRYFLRMASVLTRTMKHEEAAAVHMKALEKLDQDTHPVLSAELFMGLATNEESQGKDHQARRSLGKAHTLFEKAGNAAGEVQALHRTAALEVRNENYRKARSLLTRVEQLYTQLNRISDATKVRQHISALPEN